MNQKEKPTPLVERWAQDTEPIRVLTGPKPKPKWLTDPKNKRSKPQGKR